MTLAELKKARQDKLAEANAIYARIGDADDPPASDVKAVSDLNREIEEIEHKLKDALSTQADWQAQRAAHATRTAQDNTPVHPVPFPGSGGGANKSAADGTLTDILFNNPAFKTWLEQVAPEGVVSGAEFKHSPRVTLPRGLKALVTEGSTTSGGALVTPDYRPFISLPYQPLVLRDILNVTTTNSDVVSYPLETSRTNNAAEVGEAIDVSGSVGTKPQSDFALSRVETNVKTIAHWVAVTRMALADAGQLRPYIDDFLLKGLQLRWESQVINGDGTNNTLLGILHTPGITAQAWNTDILTTTRKALTTARITGRAQVSAFLLNPYDWETIDLSADNEHRYYYGGPMVLGTPRLWGKPVVEAEAVPQGTGLTGDFSTVIWYDRMLTQLFMSDSHQDFFVKNLIAVLAEMRGALALTRPAAIVTIDLTA